MSTREVLVKRADVANKDIDDIIEIAAELQEAEQRAADGASAADVRAVAEELDIAPEYVDEAIKKLKSQREERAQAEAEAKILADKASAQRTQLLKRVGVGLVGLGLLLCLTLGGMTLLASGQMNSAREAQTRAESNLTVVLERQATLAPQLVAMAGGSSATMASLVDDVRTAPDVAAKLKASDALGSAMATQIGKLPPASDPATAQSRADLQHEVSGIANRITVERRRYEEARIAYDQSTTGLTPAIARGLGLH